MVLSRCFHAHTRYLSDPNIEGHYDDLLSRGDFRPRRLNLKKGDCWVQDVQTLHAGTANTSNTERSEVVGATARAQVVAATNNNPFVTNNMNDTDDMNTSSFICHIQPVHWTAGILELGVRGQW